MRTKTTPFTVRRPPPRLLGRTWWSQFLRLHMRPLQREWPRAVPVAAAVGFGTALLIAFAVLYSALGRPFSSAPEDLIGQIDLQVRSEIADRVPAHVVRQVRDTEGVENAFPAVGRLQMLHAGRDRAAGALVVGTDCSARLLAAEDCQARMTRWSERDEAGVPVVMSQALAHDLGVSVGSFASVGGGPADSLYVDEVVASDAYDDANAGYWVVGEISSIAGVLGDDPDSIKAVYVTARDGVDVAGALRERLGSGFVVERPGAELSMILSATRTLVGMAGVVMLMVGVLVASTVFGVFVQSKHKPVALAFLNGGSSSVLLGIAVEAAVLGLVGAMCLVPVALVLGRWLIESVGGAMVADTGARLSADVPWLVVAALVAGGGILGGIGSSLGSLHHLREAGALPAVGREPPGRGAFPSRPILIAGLLAVVVGLAGAWAYGKGLVPQAGLLASTGVAVVGIVLAVMSLAPEMYRVFRRAVAGVGRAGAVVVASTVGREQLRLAAVVGTIGVASFILVGASASEALTAKAVVRNISAEMGSRAVVSARVQGSQISQNISEEVVAELATLEGVRAALPQYLAVVDVDEQPVNALGTAPESPRRLFRDADGEAFWSKLTEDAVVLTPPLARRLGVGEGDRIRVPTLGGERELDVAGVESTHWGYDNGVGDMMVVSDDLAREAWRAGIYSVILDSAAGTEPGALAAGVEGMGVAGLHVVTVEDLPQVGSHALDQVFQPLERIAWVTLVIAAVAVLNFMLLDLRESRARRATWRLHGFDAAAERRVVLLEGLAVGLFGALVGVFGGWVFSFIVSLAAPSIMGGRVAWAPELGAAAVGAVLVLGLSVLGTLPAVWKAGRLDIAEALRGN